MSHHGFPSRRRLLVIALGSAFACLQAGDAPALGQLMDQSHADLRDKFEVTCPEGHRPPRHPPCLYGGSGVGDDTLQR